MHRVIWIALLALASAARAESPTERVLQGELGAVFEPSDSSVPHVLARLDLPHAPGTAAPDDAESLYFRVPRGAADLNVRGGERAQLTVALRRDRYGRWWLAEPRPRTIESKKVLTIGEITVALPDAELGTADLVVEGVVRGSYHRPDTAIPRAVDHVLELEVSRVVQARGKRRPPRGELLHVTAFTLADPAQPAANVPRDVPAPGESVRVYVDEGLGALVPEGLQRLSR